MCQEGVSRRALGDRVGGFVNLNGGGGVWSLIAGNETTAADLVMWDAVR